jgi:alpha-glucosidase
MTDKMINADSRLHVLVQDAGQQVFQIQESLISRPSHEESPADASKLSFLFTEEPFAFQVTRRESGEVLFNTSIDTLVFESQYVRLSTSLPPNPNVYGLGEHSDSYRLRTYEGYRRTLWNREAPFIPRKENLYGSHPMYIEHRTTGTHGVLLLNSNGMDVNYNRSSSGDHYLEYNTIGGVLDFYFFAGPDPKDVSRQHAEAFGLPAMAPYWSLGFHQAKYGYWDVNFLAEVVANHSAANIPLEVIWADIDHMHLRKDFTVDPERFPMDKMRELVHTVHERGQRFVMIVDPGISTDEHPTLARGRELGAFLKAEDGSDYRGVQWAGEVVWPDYMSPEADEWWTQEISTFFDPDTGLDSDGIWIDMNEASNFCPDVTCDPKKHADDTNTPPDPSNPPRDNTGRPIPGFPDSFQPPQQKLRTRQTEDGDKKGLPDRDLLNPSYEISNALGNISDSTLWTNITNHDGTRQYDTHNMYGLSMTKATNRAMVNRRPGKRPFVLSRSTFLTSGVWGFHWFGDNFSAWDDYRLSIAQMLGFTTVHNMPMVGTDVCGFNGDAQELMCARWAMLASFMPFMRNHADISAPFQEFYLWESVTNAARKALDARYRLLDYLYTALYLSSSTGVPSVNPLFFLYPSDEKTYDIDLQFVLGDAILVCPIVEDDAQTVTFYLPDDIFYDFWTHEPVRGGGENVTLDEVSWTDIPVYIRGGSVIPLRAESANTTATLRKKNFEIIVAPGLDGNADGVLFLDDGESTIGGEAGESLLEFSWNGDTLRVDGRFGYTSDLAVQSVTVLGEGGNRTVDGDWSLDGPFEVSVPAK